MKSESSVGLESCYQQNYLGCDILYLAVALITSIPLYMWLQKLGNEMVLVTFLNREKNGIQFPTMSLKERHCQDCYNRFHNGRSMHENKHCLESTKWFFVRSKKRWLCSERRGSVIAHFQEGSQIYCTATHFHFHLNSWEKLRA